MGENPSEECDRLIAPAEGELTPPTPEDLDEGQEDEQEEEVEPFRKAASPMSPSEEDDTYEEDVDSDVQVHLSCYPEAEIPPNHPRWANWRGPA